MDIYLFFYEIRNKLDGYLQKGQTYYYGIHTKVRCDANLNFFDINAFPEVYLSIRTRIVMVHVFIYCLLLFKMSCFHLIVLNVFKIVLILRKITQFFSNLLLYFFFIGLFGNRLLPANGSLI